VGKRHEFWGLIGGITEHVALITSTNLLVFLSNVNTLSDIWALLFNCNKDIASLVVKSFGGIIKTDSLDSSSNDLLVVQV